MDGVQIIPLFILYFPLGKQKFLSARIFYSPHKMSSPFLLLLHSLDQIIPFLIPNLSYSLLHLLKTNQTKTG